MLVNEQDVKKRFPSFPFFQLKKIMYSLLRVQGSSSLLLGPLLMSSLVQNRSNLGAVQVQLRFI